MNKYADFVARAQSEYIHSDPDRAQARSLSESELAEIEREIGHPLPADYREFFKDYGGFEFRPNRCPLAALYHQGDWHFGVASLGTLHGHQPNAVFNLLRTYKEEPDYLPKELIQIAQDGNVGLFMAVSGEHRGSVYQWYPDPFPDRLFYYPELELVARSFDDFIASLRFQEEGQDAPTPEELAEAEARKQQIAAIQLDADNHFTPIMRSLSARYVYSPINECGLSMSEAELHLLETTIEAELPEDYREFLRHYSGYAFPRGIYAPGDVRYHFFHANFKNDYHSLLEHYFRLKDHLPPHVFPIGDGGQLCIQLDGRQAGAIYRVDRKVTKITSHPDYKNDDPPIAREQIQMVAPTLTAYMQSLVE